LLHYRDVRERRHLCLIWRVIIDGFLLQPHTHTLSLSLSLTHTRDNTQGLNVPTQTKKVSRQAASALSFFSTTNQQNEHGCVERSTIVTLLEQPLPHNPTAEQLSNTQACNRCEREAQLVGGISKIE
jgi:hypothetical protein